MATNPMMPMDAMGETEPLKSVTIEAQADGTFTVDGEPVQSVDEALDMARQILQDTGEGTPDEQMLAGYNKNNPMTARPKPAQVFGE